MDGLGPHFLLANSLKWWYLVLQQSRMSLKCFLKVSWESKVIPKNSLEDILLESRHIVLGWVLFFWRVWNWRIYSSWFLRD